MFVSFQRISRFNKIRDLIFTASRGIMLSGRRSMDSVPSNDMPLIVVLGATGVGKTKLAVEICQRFNGEVLSADSMQIYEGLDIITNKVTPEEACGIPHHMIGIVSPSSSSTFNVQIFQQRALKIINEIQKDRNSIPVIVGGTNYYIEALLWNRLINDSDDSNRNDDLKSDDIAESENFTKCLPFDVNSMNDEQLHDELRRVDPTMADRQHPKNRRKVIRSLQIFYSSGRPHSQWLSDQHATSGGSILGGPPRFNRVCVLWLTCDDREVLKERLRRRVDEMVIRGLQEEITTFYDRYYADYLQKFGPDANAKGILQSIGLKEFEDFLKLPMDQRSSEIGTKAFEEGLETLKQVTIQYARKQYQWIVNRFCQLAARDSIPVYCLDTTDASKWSEVVSAPAVEIIESFFAGRKVEIDVKMATISQMSERLMENQFCNSCQRLIPGAQWTDHLKSKRHRLQLYKEKRRLLMEEAMKTSK